MSASWQDDPFVFDDAFDQAVTGDPPSKKGTRKLGDRHVLAWSLLSLACAVVAVAMGANEAGWLTVAVGGLAYLAAAAGDLRQRSIRHARRVYGRPWPTALLRIVVFLAVVGSAWLAASGLAAP